MGLFPLYIPSIYTAKLNQLPKQSDMSQEKLAEMCDGGTTHISHIETGNCISSLQVFKDNELALILAMLRLQKIIKDMLQMKNFHFTKGKGGCGFND